jgi:hypothetical protein
MNFVANLGKWCSLNFRQIAIGSSLWETVDMPNPKNYVPKINDFVLVRGHMGRLVVVSVDAEKKTADVKTVAGPIVLTRGVPWELLSYLDESQNAPRIVSEATDE